MATILFCDGGRLGEATINVQMVPQVFSTIFYLLLASKLVSKRIGLLLGSKLVLQLQF